MEHNTESEHEERTREQFFSLITPHLDPLHQVTGYLIRFAEVMGDIGENDLTAEEIVDGTLVRAYRQFKKGLGGQDIRGWLIRLSIEELVKQVRRLKSECERTPVHLEDVQDILPETLT